MKRLIFPIVLLFIVSVMAHAQSNVETSKYKCAYKNFQMAKIYMHSGDTIQALANVFLKNSGLYFMRGSVMLQADMNNVDSVEFKDRRYVKIDTLLAAVVGSYKNNCLLCSREIDLAALSGMRRNAAIVTDISLSAGNYLDVNKWSPNDNDTTMEYPLHRKYFYYYNGQYIYVSDRTLYKYIPKDKRTVYRTVSQQDEFDWYSEKWLMRLLKYIS